MCAACQLLGSVASRTFGIPLLREVSYKYVGCNIDESVLTDAANNQQQTINLIDTSMNSLLNYFLLSNEIYILVNPMRNPGYLGTSM